MQDDQSRAFMSALRSRVGLPKSECATDAKAVGVQRVYRAEEARAHGPKSTGEGVPISARRIVMFKPSKVLKQGINGRRSHL
jgi:hypothetical protein